MAFVSSDDLRLSDWRVLSGTLAVLFALNRLLKLLNGIKAVGSVPGLRVPFQPLTMIGASVPTCWWNPGRSFTWAWRHTFYRKWNSEVVSVVPFLSGAPVLYSNSLEVARQVVGAGIKSPWVKPEPSLKPVMLWGMNLIASEGLTWRRHRRIMGPAFNPKTYALVWSETGRLYRAMVASDFGERKTVHIDVVQHYTFKLALYVIAACGFGWSFQWDDPPVDADDGMTIQEALKINVDYTVLWLVAPRWIYKLPIKSLRRVPVAHSVLAAYMKRSVAERREEINDVAGKEKTDVFSLLVKANMEEGGKLALDDDEVIGNIFALMFAGHETTAHTLAATLGFLSIYPHIQKEIYEEIINVVGHERDPVFEDFGKLEKVLAAFYEALRLYPAGYVMIREASEDTVLHVSDSPTDDSTHPIMIQKGAQAVIDVVGIENNPRYFPDPDKYDPSRWYGTTTDSEAVTAFSIGPRTCIGRKFAATEAVCFLTHLLRDWSIAPVLKDGESGEEWRARVMPAQLEMTLGVGKVPIVLTRR